MNLFTLLFGVGEYTGIAKSIQGVTAALEAMGISAAAAINILAGFAAVAIAIYGAYKIWDVLVETFDESVQKAADSAAQYQQTQSEIERINGQLEETQAKIDELQDKGPLTFTEKKELGNLQHQNDLLEKELELQTQLASMQKQQAESDALGVLTNKTYKGDYAIYADGTSNKRTWWRSLLDPGRGAEQDLDIIEYTEYQQNRLKELNSEYDSLLADRKKASEVYGEDSPIVAHIDASIKRIKTEIDNVNADLIKSWDVIKQYMGDIVDPATIKRLNALYWDFTNQDFSEAATGADIFEEKFGRVKETAEDVAGSVKKSFSEILGDETLSTNIDNYTSNISKLQSALEKFRNGELEPTDLLELEKEFPELIGHTEDLDEAILHLMDNMETDAVRQLEDQLKNCATDEDRARLQAYIDTLKQINDVSVDNVDKALSATQSVISSISSVQGILSSAAAGKTLSIDDLSSDAIKDYASAIEYANGGMQLNAQKVRDIVEAKAKEQIAYNDTSKALLQQQYIKNARTIEDYRHSLDRLEDQESSQAQSIKNSINALLEENGALANEIKQYDAMSEALREATSAYNNWLNAQNASDYGDMFSDYSDAYKRIVDTFDPDSDIFGQVGSKKFEAAVEFLIPDTINTDDEGAIKSYMDRLKSYMTFDDDGNVDGMNIQKFCEDAVNAGLMVFDESSDSWQIAGETTMEDFARGMNLSAGVVQAFFDQMSLFGGKFSFADEGVKTFGDLAVEANNAAEALHGMDQYKDLKFVVNVEGYEDTDGAIKALDNTIETMNGIKADVNVDASSVQYANSVIAYCIAQKQQLTKPSIMRVDTSQVTGDLGSALELLQNFQSAMDNLEYAEAVFGVDSSEVEEAQQAVEDALKAIQDSDLIAKVGLEINSETVDSCLESINGITADDLVVKLGIDPSLVDDYVAPDKDATVEYDIDTTKPDRYKPKNKLAKVIFSVDSSKVNSYRPPNKTATITYTVNTVNGNNSSSSGGNKLWNYTRPYVNGTAHGGGTAFASGNWGTASGGRTLVGELGREIVVNPYSGQWYTVGDNGAEFVNIPRGSIVFNHKQTEDLLKHGYVAGRASALVSGTAMVSGGISRTNANRSSSSKSSSSSSSSSKYSNSASSVTATSIADDAEELDWIETLLERIEQRVSRLDATFEASFLDINRRTEAGREKIEALTEEYEALSGAAEAYLNAANSVDLDEHYKQLVREGAIELESITDESLKKAIEKYKGYIEKYYDVTEKSLSAMADLAETYAEIFNQINTHFDHLVTHLDNAQSRIETMIEIAEASGEAISREFYDELIAYEEQKTETLQAKLEALEAEFQNAMDSNTIEEGSDDWFNFREQIDDVTQALLESKLAVIQYKNEIVDLYDKIPDSYNSIIGQLEHQQNMLEKELTISEFMAHRSTGDIRGELIGNQQELLQTYDMEASRLRSELQHLLDEGTVKKYTSRYYELLSVINDIEEKAADARISINQYQQDEFNSIEATYTAKLNRISSRASLIQAQLSTVEARGYVAGKSYYQAMIAAEQEQIGLLQQQKKEMQDYLNMMVAAGQIQVGSMQWYQMQSAIDAVSVSIAQATQKIAEYEQQIRKLQYEQFDYSMDLINDINDEAEFLIKLMEYNNDLVKTWDRAYRDAGGMMDAMDTESLGSFTDEGMAVLGLRAQQYMTYMDMAMRYADERADIEAKLAADPYNKELLDRKYELMKAQRQSILNAYEERDALKSLVKEGIDGQLDAMSKLIDAYKDALDNAKSLYDYQKKVDEQSKKISQLRKQLSAYRGDDSEETRKTIQKLKDDLVKAEKDLEETQYNQYISDQKKLLDKLYDQYELNLNSRLDDVDGLIQDLTNTVVAESNDIWSTIQSTATDVGYSIDTGTRTIWENVCASANSMEGSITNGFDVMKTAVNNATSNIVSYVDKIYNAMQAQIAAENARDILAEMQANSEAWWDADDAMKEYYHKRNEVLAPEYEEITGNKLSFDSKSGYWIDSAGNHAYEVNGGAKKAAQSPSEKLITETSEKTETTVRKLVGQMVDNSNTWKILQEKNANPKVETHAQKDLRDANDEIAKEIAKRTGEKVWRDKAGVWWIGDDELYKRYGFPTTFHSGGIVGNGSPSENEVFAKLLKGEMVLPVNTVQSLVRGNQMTKAITADISRTIPSPDGSGNTYNSTMEVYLPNVRNYEDFANALTTDKRFEKFIQAVTIDPVAGKPTLAKTKYRW